MDRVSYIIVLSAIFGMLANFAAAQNVHVVGDSMGWTIPSNTSAYSNWASGKTFMVGDILVFNFMSNQHDVVQVPLASYDACSDDNAIGNIITTGPANITLDSAGDRHYICSIGRHCESGQKLRITVASSGGATPPMTTPTPTPTTPSPATPDEPDACAPTPTPTPIEGPTAGSGATPPPTTATTSASLSLATSSSFFLIIMAAALAFI